jgi:hypothetical protein
VRQRESELRTGTLAPHNGSEQELANELSPIERALVRALVSSISKEIGSEQQALQPAGVI